MKKKNIFIVLITLLILLSSYQSVLAVKLNKENFSGIDTLINEYIDERKEATASVSLGIFKDGEVIYEKYYGLIDVENKKSADKDSIYEWGSVTKALIWVSVMQLVEEGKIDLEEDINSYFSEDLHSCKIKVSEEIFELTKVEFEVLKLFMESPNRVFTKE